MPTAHRPGRESSKSPKPLFEKFITSIHNRNLLKMRVLLAELERAPPAGMWMHSALAQALKIHADNQIEFVDCLFKSPLAPKDSAKADFIIAAITQSAKPEVVKLLLRKGFAPRRKGCKFIFDRLERGGMSNLDIQWIYPHHLHEAEEDALIHACAIALCQNATEHWKKTLAGALRDPFPTNKITQNIVDQVLRKGGKEIPSRETLEWAEDHHWFSREEALSACARAEKSYAHSPNVIAHLGAFLAYLDGETIHDNTQAVVVASPCKRRL